MARTAKTAKKTGAPARRPATAPRSTGRSGGGALGADGGGNGPGGPLGGGSSGGGGGNGRYMPPLNDITAFPLLTEEVTLPSAPSGIGGGSADIGQRAMAAVRDVLGWRPNAADARGFKSALEQSFQLREVEGHVSWSYTPRGYAMMADMGAVTGAQASLLNRARSAVDLVRPLVTSLTPLGVFSAPEDYEPIRSMVLSELDVLLTEFAQQAGPRTQVVDDAFRQLLGAGIVDPALSPTHPVPPGQDPIQYGLLRGIQLRQALKNHPGSFADVVQGFGHLYTLQERMGLNRDQVNTVDDERIVSNFMTVEDTVFSLWLTWWQERAFFGRLGAIGFEPFLGTQLVLVSRSLSVVAEAVQELYFSLDSVFIGPPERQTIRLDLAEGALYLSELLQWAEDIATTSGPRYVSDGGKDGVIALSDRVAKLQRCVEGTVALARNAQLSFPGMASPRVRYALEKLAKQISELRDLTDDFRRGAAAEGLFEAPVREMLSDRDAD